MSKKNIRVDVIEKEYFIIWEIEGQQSSMVFKATEDWFFRKVWCPLSEGEHIRIGNRILSPRIILSVLPFGWDHENVQSI